MKILLVEDVTNKAQRICNCIYNAFLDSEIIIKESYHSASVEIVKHHQDYDIVLLDMSMPSYDSSEEESGGVPEAIAGRRILEKMFLKEITTKVIVVTMYDKFEGEKLVEMDKSFQETYKDFYYGYVFFSFENADWQLQLIKMIKDYEQNFNR